MRRRQGQQVALSRHTTGVEAVGAVILVGTASSERCDRRQDERGVELGQVVMTEAHALHLLARSALDQDVHIPDQLFEDLPTSGPPRVQGCVLVGFGTQRVEVASITGLWWAEFDTSDDPEHVRTALASMQAERLEARLPSPPAA